MSWEIYIEKKQKTTATFEIMVDFEMKYNANFNERTSFQNSDGFMSNMIVHR